MLAAAVFELTVDLRDFSPDSQASIEPIDDEDLLMADHRRTQTVRPAICFYCVTWKPTNPDSEFTCRMTTVKLGDLLGIPLVVCSRRRV